MTDRFRSNPAVAVLAGTLVRLVQRGLHHLGRHQRRIQTHRPGRSRQTLGRAQIQTQHELRQTQSSSTVITLSLRFNHIATTSLVQKSSYRHGWSSFRIQGIILISNWYLSINGGCAGQREGREREESIDEIQAQPVYNRSESASSTERSTERHRRLRGHALRRSNKEKKRHAAKSFCIWIIYRCGIMNNGWMFWQRSQLPFPAFDVSTNRSLVANEPRRCVQFFLFC